METDAQKIAHIRAGVLDDDARKAYALAYQRTDTTGGLGTVDSCLDGAQLFEVVHDGVIVARYALKQANRARGTEIFIAAAVGAAPGADLTASILPAIEKQCSGADRLTVNTRRRGLVKKLVAQGWTIDCYVLRKRLK